MGTKQSFRSAGRQRITEKAICEVANGGGGANIKESREKRAQCAGLERESARSCNGCNPKGHTLLRGRLKTATILVYCLKRPRVPLTIANVTLRRSILRMGDTPLAKTVLDVDRACLSLSLCIDRWQASNRSDRDGIRDATASFDT